MAATEAVESGNNIGHAAATAMAAAFPSWTAFLTPGILIISTSVAVAAILFARRTARQKATLDLIERVEATEYYRDLRTAFSSHRQANSLSRLHKPVTYADKLDRQKIQDFLNHHEIISSTPFRIAID
ncbi:MAG: DUF4760 domain-containing protein, partial [Pseudomonadota bacterium]